MTRTMYDAVTPSRIPADAAMVAGYADGRYANLAEMRQRFPHATVVSIAVSSKTRAQVLDVEPGDASPQTAVTWCTQTMHDVPNTELTIYCNASTVAAVKAAFKSAGVSLPQFWVADWDRKAEVPAGAVAKQHTSTPGYDISTVADHWPGVDGKAPTSGAGSTPAKPKPAPGGTYTVRQNDNLSGIAEAHGVSLAALEKANPQIKNPNLIHPGDVIYLPGGASKPAAPKTYTVRENDNLSTIAAAHGLSLADIERLNPQIHNPNLIHPGDIIKIK